MLKMSPRSKMESPTCDYEKKTKIEKGHFKTLALSGQCNNNLHCATKIEPPWLTMAEVIKACIVIGLQRCTVADYGSKLLYLVTILQFYAR